MKIFTIIFTLKIMNYDGADSFGELCFRDNIKHQG